MCSTSPWNSKLWTLVDYRTLWQPQFLFEGMAVMTVAPLVQLSCTNDSHYASCPPAIRYALACLVHHCAHQDLPAGWSFTAHTGCYHQLWWARFTQAWSGWARHCALPCVHCQRDEECVQAQDAQGGRSSSVWSRSPAVFVWPGKLPYLWTCNALLLFCLQYDADMMWVIEHLHWIPCFSFCDGAAVNVGFDCDVAIYTTPLYGCVAWHALRKCIRELHAAGQLPSQ